MRAGPGPAHASRSPSILRDVPGNTKERDARDGRRIPYSLHPAFPVKAPGAEGPLRGRGRVTMGGRGRGVDAEGARRCQEGCCAL
jgi:hypothetical protein